MSIETGPGNLPDRRTANSFINSQEHDVAAHLAAKGAANLLGGEAEKKYPAAEGMRSIAVPMPSRRAVQTYLLQAAGILSLMYLAYVVREIWLPLAVAFLLATILDPVVDRMEMRGWTRPRASAFIFGSFLFIIVGLGFLLYPLVAHQVEALEAGFAARFPDTSHQGLLHAFRSFGLPAWMANGAVASLENAHNGLQRSSDWIANFGMSVASNLIWIVIVPIVAFYALRDFHMILAKGLILVPAQRRDLVQTAVTEISGVFGKYLRGLSIVSVMNGVATSILLAILQVPGAVILGVIAGVLYSVPYIGPLLTIIATGAFAFVGGGIHMAALAIGLSVVLHSIVFDQIITPRILGGHVGLHPILSIFALLVGNLLLGIVGMVLAVPVAACIQIAVLALIPKLSRKIEISHAPSEPEDTVDSLARETQEAEHSLDATQEMHASVISAVESIEKEETK